jgi:hypothetical protein
MNVLKTKPAHLHLTMTMDQARKLGVMMMGSDEPGLACLGMNLAMDVDEMNFVDDYIYHNGTQEGCALINPE